MPPKRRLSSSATSATSKRTRRQNHLSALSDELIIRILSFVDERSLLETALVCKRLHSVTADAQLWREHYYRRFILPRAPRSSVRKLSFYTAQKSAWAEAAARRSGISTPSSDIAPQDMADALDWKKQYKLRHNWAKGQCAVAQVRVHELQRDPTLEWQTLVKVVEGLAVTADGQSGLRAWDLRTKNTIVEIDLDGSPACLAVDDGRLPDGSLDVAVGFYDGTFGLWRLDIKRRLLSLVYRQAQSSLGKLSAIATGFPYVLTATEPGFISLYSFGADAAAPQDNITNIESTTTTPPKLLTSLKAHSTRSPLALSIRRTPASVVASIAYTFDAVGGWSIGIQDLAIHPTGAVTSRIASTLPSQTRTSLSSQAAVLPLSSDGADVEESGGPTRLCYSHPYLLATLPDNTLVLHLCTSSATSLSISPAIRLWGHTSGISDAEITPRGKAVSVSTRGNEIRLWELEGRAGGTSVTVKPRQDASDEDEDERRHWVGFDEEMVIVLKEASDGRDSLVVYDFT